MLKLKLLLIIHFIFVFPFCLLFGKTAVIDSLKNELTILGEDTLKVNLLIDISKNLVSNDPDEALEYSDRALKLSEQLNFRKGEAFAEKWKGIAYYYKNEPSLVLDHWKKSLDIFESIKYKKGISNIQSNIGAVYSDKGDDAKALDYYIKSIRIAEQIKDTFRIVSASINISAVYLENPATYDQAIEYAQKALKLSEITNSKLNASMASNNIGEVYLNKKEYQKALKYFNKSIDALELSSQKYSAVLNNIGKVYLQKGDYILAVDYFKRALKSAGDIDFKIQISKSHLNLASAYNKQKLYNSSIKQYNKAIDIAKKLEINTDLRDAYLGLSKAYANIGMHKNAYDYHNLYSSVKDIIRSESYDENISNLRFQFNSENKEKEIKLLSKNNEIKEAKINQANSTKNFLFALAGLLSLVIIGVSYQNGIVKKLNKTIDEERQRAESVLLNILPKETAKELKKNGFVKTRKFDQTTVLFTDFKSFSKVADGMSPEELIKNIDFYFKKFDEIISNNNLEKIKTIGDAYMCAGGLPNVNSTNANDAFNAASEILEFVNKTKSNPPKDIIPFDIRIGLNTGPVVAGVVGTKKFQYDIWGQTVNIASRMESSSVAGKINVSENTYQLLKDKHNFVYRGELEVKNLNKMKMYFAEKV